VRRDARAGLLAVGCAGVLAACSMSGSTPPPPPPPVDGGGITMWLAPNGSEVVLKLVTTPPTVPF
jgi:hypothetical protein